MFSMLCPKWIKSSLLQIRSAVAEYERTLIGERMRRGRLMKYRAGQLLPWGRRPYGYQLDLDRPRDPAGVRLAESEAVVVTQIFTWYLEPGVSLYEIAKRLYDLGIPAPRGKATWSTSTIRGILTNPAYTGTAYANRLRSVPAHRRHSALEPVGAGQSTVLKPAAEWIPISVPAIVPAETFASVQQKLAQNQQAASRNNTRYAYLLRGLVSCGQCRLSARARTLNGKYQYYQCHSRAKPVRAVTRGRCPMRYVPAAELDDVVWHDLCRVLTTPELITHALERAHGGHWIPQELQMRIKNVAQAEQQLGRQQGRLLDAYLAGIVGLVEFERKHQEITHKQAALAREGQQLQASAAQRAALAETLASIDQFCEQVRAVLATASFAQRRHLVELLIDRVIVTDEQVEIRYVIPTQPDGPHVPFSQLRTDYLIVLGRIVDAVRIGDQRAEEGTDLQQLVPILARARQARDLDPQDQPHMIETDFGDQALKADAPFGMGPRLAQIVVNHDYPIRSPAQVACPCH